ncbi:MAG: M23 family metallopeptidase [Caulobacteraceae bacterium]
MNGDGGGNAKVPFRLAVLASSALALAVALPLAGHGRRAADAPRGKPTAPHQVPLEKQTLTVEMRPRESLAGALIRSGLNPGEAGRAADALGEDFDIVNPHPGLKLDLTLVRSPGGSPRLVGLAFNPGDDRRVSAWRGADGSLRVRDAQTQAFSVPSRIDGKVEGSLYLSLVDAGVDTPVAARVVGLFGRRLDLSRDIESGDRFALVFEQARSTDGEAAAAPSLLYAEVAGGTRRTAIYRFQPPGGGPVDYLDGEAGPSRPLLLRTPVDGARITSSFGLRLHPILGFTRMHQGVDFGASLGAPVLAAGDGVVEEARWAGGYGRWLKIRHDRGLETGYAHLSAWAAGVAPGARVRQGQVVAYVGATGLATGPHLHYEVFAGGQRIDPQLARAAGPEGVDPLRRIAFRAQKARIDAIVGG